MCVCVSLLLLLGDFNARVGSRLAMCSGNRYDTMSCEEFPWGATLGPFGLGAVNTAGEHLLSFCSSNDLSIMSKKKNIIVAHGLILLHNSLT